MLPDLRAVIAAVIAAVGLMMAAFGVTATFRVAHENRISPLQAARSALHADVVLRAEAAAPANMAREETPQAPNEQPRASVEIPANAMPSIAPTAEPAPAVVAAPAPVVAALPSPSPTAADDTPEVTGSVTAVPHAGAPVAAVPAPAAEPPVGGPLQEQAALTIADDPDLRAVVVKNKPRTTLKRQPRGSRQARARAAAKRIAAEQARRARAVQTDPFQPFPQQPAFRQ